MLIRRSFSTKNPVLELFFYRGRFQLATDDALYSDGHRYRPLVKAFNKMKDELPGVRSVLMLGTGLGSAAQILKRHGVYPAYTMIDNDETVLRWASEVIPAIKDMTLVCDDAKLFMDKNDRQYDLVIIDIFRGQVVPGFVTTKDFLEKCRQAVMPGGHMVFNYIIHSADEWKAAEEHLDAVYPGNKKYEFGINRIVIAQV